MCFGVELCVSMTLRKGDYVCSKLGMGATSEAGKSLFRATNVCVEVCAVFCYCLLWLDA